MRKDDKHISGGKNHMVECLFNGAVIQIPDEIFFSTLMGRPLVDKRFVRYKDGAKMYGMSERTFYDLVRDAEAIYKRSNMALIKIEKVDEFLEFFHE